MEFNRRSGDFCVVLSESIWRNLLTSGLHLFEATSSSMLSREFKGQICDDFRRTYLVELALYAFCSLVGTPKNWLELKRCDLDDCRFWPNSIVS